MLTLKKTLVGGTAALLVAQAPALANGPHINEIYASHTGTDDMEMIELIGAPGMSLDGIMVCIIEGDDSSSLTGALDRAWDLTGLTIPASGYFVLGDTAVTPNDFDIGASDRIENGSETFYVVETSDPAAILALIGTDMDPDDDLRTILADRTKVLDCVAMIDDDVLDEVYDQAPIIGPDGAFLPAGVYRASDFPGSWCSDTFLDFDDVLNLAEPRTPGAANGICPTAGVPYCTPGVTTNLCEAVAWTTGIPSVAATSGYQIDVTCVEGDKNGIIFYGITGAIASPWGMSSSFLCVKAPTQRTQSQNSGGNAGECNGRMRLDFLAYLASNPGALGNPFSAGDMVWAQGWFRDPPSPKTTNLSSGVMFTMVP